MKRELEARRDTVLINIEEIEGIRGRPLGLNTVELLKICS